MKITNIVISVLFLVILESGNAFAQTKVIAHRGFWQTEGSAQNSITSLKKANEANVYGSEFDVSITADGVAVVNHDDTIKGIVIETAKYKEIKNIKLSNGEKLPTLEQYLKAGKSCKGTQLILEIKPHKLKENEDRAVDESLALVKKFKMENQVEFISFSMNICERLIQKAPKASVAYLRGDVTPKELKAKGFTGLDYYYKHIEKNPQWIQEAHDAGLSVNVWTVNDPQILNNLVKMKADFITTDRPVEWKEILLNK